MTPADRDAAVALAQQYVASSNPEWGAIDRLHFITEAGDIGALTGAQCMTICRALAERPTCDWQPMATAPKDGKDVVVYRGYGQGVTMAFWDVARGGLWSQWPGREPVAFTHWMRPAQPTPLPSCSICRRDDCGGDHPCVKHP